MAFLTGEHYDDVIAHYKQYDITRLANIEDFKLNVDLEIEKAPKVFNMEDFDYWKYKSDYLTKRGITEKAQRAFRIRSEEHTSELQSRFDLVCRLLLEKKNKRRL